MTSLIFRMWQLRCWAWWPRFARRCWRFLNFGLVCSMKKRSSLFCESWSQSSFSTITSIRLELLPKVKHSLIFGLIIPSIFTVQILCWSIHYLVNNSCLTSYLIHFELVQLIYWCFNRNSCGREGLRQSTTWTRKVPRRRYFFINNNV